jgi:hypothetical protein
VRERESDVKEIRTLDTLLADFALITLPWVPC